MLEGLGILGDKVPDLNCRCVSVEECLCFCNEVVDSEEGLSPK